jgi:UDP-glucose 4-epimerase
MAAHVIADVAPSHLVHFAAIHYVPYCNNNPEEVFNTNVMGTRNVLESAATLDDLRQVTYASTAAVYPPSDDLHREVDVVGPTDVYGRTKLVGEDLLAKYTSNASFRSVSLRLFNIYGEHETNPHVIPAILDQLTRDNPVVDLGNTSPKRDFIHVSDVVGAVLTALSGFGGSYRAYNVGTGVDHSVNELVMLIGDITDLSIEIRTDRERTRVSDRPRMRADCTRIADELGWRNDLDLGTGLETLIDNEYQHLLAE